MVSIYENSNQRTKKDGLEVKAIEFRGVSTDTKPVKVGEDDVVNGSVFIEIDTGKLFFFDGDSKTWKEA